MCLGGWRQSQALRVEKGFKKGRGGGGNGRERSHGPLVRHSQDVSCPLCRGQTVVGDPVGDDGGEDQVEATEQARRAQVLDSSSELGAADAVDMGCRRDAE